jgi:hypothetical protein
MINRLLFSLLFILCLAGGAQAEVFWSTVGSNCVPDDAKTRLNRHRINSASVQHAPDNVDLITLNCPVTKFETPLSSFNIGVTYRDSTGIGTSAFIRARLFRLDNASITPVLVGQFNSNDFGVTGSTHRLSPEFIHPFEFSTNNYWIRVEIDRSSTSQTVIFHSVLLDGNPM